MKTSSLPGYGQPTTLSETGYYYLHALGASYTPYDRTYICTQAGTSGNNWTVFLDSTASSDNARQEGVPFATDGSVTWQPELNTTPSLLTVFTRTGSVNAYPIYFADHLSSTLDVFRYAETGEAAK